MKNKATPQIISKRARMNRWLNHVTSYDANVYVRHVDGKKAESTLLTKAAKQNFRGLTDQESLKLEAIVATTGRPVVLVKSGQVDGVPAGAEWQSRIAGASSIIEAVMPSVGRIEMRGSALNLAGTEFSDRMIGTGFVVARNIIVTNRHVAQVFCNEDGSVRADMGARIDFVEEHERDPDEEFRIVRALEIGQDYDYAILEVEGGGTFPRPLELASNPIPADQFPMVFAVGYPAFDNRNPTKVQREIFGDIFEVKRFAPGRLRRAVQDGALTLLEGDYTTLGGNSGSPIFDFDTGEVVGLHFSGAYLEANFSVPMSILKARIDAAIHRSGNEGRLVTIAPAASGMDERLDRIATALERLVAKSTPRLAKESASLETTASDDEIRQFILADVMTRATKISGNSNVTPFSKPTALFPSVPGRLIYISSVNSRWGTDFEASSPAMNGTLTTLTEAIFTSLPA